MLEDTNKLEKTEKEIMARCKELMEDYKKTHAFLKRSEKEALELLSGEEWLDDQESKTD